MTQDQYGQARGTDYGASGDVVDDNTGDSSDQGKPMTRFQKVASALRGDRPDRDEADEEQLAADQTDPNTAPAEGSSMTAGYGTIAAPGATADTGMTAGYGTAAAPGATTDADALPDGQEGRTANSSRGPDSVQAAPVAEGQRGDYWDVPNPREDQVIVVTSPDSPVTDTGKAPLTGQDETRPDIADVQDPARTPDIYGTSREAGDPVGGDQAGAATISDAPVTQQDAAVAEGPDGTGRHAATGPAQELRHGETDSTLDDLGDLSYGNLLPDASHFTEQWQQIQFRFVDDPQASVTEAAEVVAQVTAKLEAAIQERQRAIAARQQAIQERQRSLRGRWSEGTEADTETLRETLRMYRAFLDQLIGPKA
jgi:hypothetical protein